MIGLILPCSGDEPATHSSVSGRLSFRLRIAAAAPLEPRPRLGDPAELVEDLLAVGQATGDLIYEILAVGDAHFQAKCYDRLDEFRRQGVTIVIVTHALAEVQRLCERAVWLDGGKIAMQGEPEAVIEAYAKS